MRYGLLLDGVFADIRLATRAILRRPASSAVTLSSVALGVGGCAVAFSIAAYIHLRPLAFPDPGRLAEILDDAPDVLSAATADNWAAEFGRIATVGRWRAHQALVSTPSGTVRMAVTAVDTNFLRVLGTTPALGPATGDVLARQSGGVLLSHSAWVTHFGMDLSVVGRKMTMDNVQFTVVGVMPADFDYPTQTRIWALDQDLVTVGTGRAYALVARARSDASVLQLRALAAVLSPLDADGSIRRSHAAVRSLSDVLRPGMGTGTLGLLAGSLCLLLIATANTLTLFVGRADERRHSIAVRIALGCPAARLTRLFVIESALLGIVGGLSGYGVAVVLHRLIERIGWLQRVGLENLEIGWAGLAVAVILGLGSATVAALLPLLLVRGNVAVLLRSASADDRQPRGWVRDMLVIGEVALAFVLGVSAAALFDIYAESQRAPLAFRVENVHFATATIPGDLVPADRQALVQNVLERLRANPATRDVVAWGTFYPNAGRRSDEAMSLEGADAPQRYPGSPSASFDVSQDFFRVMDLQIVAGRAFDATDGSGTARVVILTKAAADQLWSGQDPLGRRMKLGPPAGSGEWMTVVGIVENTQPLHFLAGRYAVAGPPRAALMFRPLAQGEVLGQEFAISPGFVVATIPRAGLSEVDRVVRETLASAHPMLAVSYAGSLREYLNRGGDLDLGKMVSQTVLITCAVAIALALIGIAAVLGDAIRRRRHEFGIRLALGAPPRTLVAMIVHDALRLGAIGTATGALLAALLLMTVGASVVREGRPMHGSVFNVDVLEPTIFAIVASTILVLIAAAALLQARAIARIHPSSVLGHE